MRRFVFWLATVGGLLADSLTLLIVFLVVAWVLCAWRWPFAPCWWCRGRKVNHGSSRKRFGSCRMCKGSGMRQVAGSRALHKLIVVAGERRREKAGR